MLGALLLLIGAVIWFQVMSTRNGTAPSHSYTATRTYPHDADAYTQGLIFYEGALFEGTGNYGQSALRRVELETGKVLQEHKLDRRYFGEGITIWKDQILQLTWRNRLGLVYDLHTFELKKTFSYRGEGWGLTHDGQQLIMSDGTATLRFIDPSTFRVTRQITVRDGRTRIVNLNELEYVEGEIYANVWYQDRIARIHPADGRVISWLDLSQLFPKRKRPHRDAVLNGIAYDPQQRRLLVTGKKLAPAV